MSDNESQCVESHNFLCVSNGEVWVRKANKI